MQAHIISNILEAGAILIVVAGVIGGFWAGFKGKKSTSTTDANETIALINEAKKALEEKIAAQAVVIADQEKRISDLELVNASYVKLFQGNPSTLEAYMHETALAIKELATAQTAILGLLQGHSATSVTINK